MLAQRPTLDDLDLHQVVELAPDRHPAAVYLARLAEVLLWIVEPRREAAP